MLELFIAVAEEGNVTRAADRVHLSQPALSKQVMKLERELGVRLFDRLNHGLELTDAGQVLLDHARNLVVDWSAIALDVRQAAAVQEKTLRVGFVSTAANEFTHDIINELYRRCPECHVQLQQLSCVAPADAVLTSRVDVAIVRLPLRHAVDLRVVPLFEEARWVALPDGHRLASQERISLHDLIDEPFVSLPVESGDWSGFWIGDDVLNRESIRVSRIVSTPDEWLEAIACGFGVSFTPEANARFYRRPGVTYRPVEGLPAGEVAIATRRGRRSSLVEEFIASCRVVVS